MIHTKTNKPLLSYCMSVHRHVCALHISSPNDCEGDAFPDLSELKVIFFVTPFKKKSLILIFIPCVAFQWKKCTNVLILHCDGNI